MLKIFEKSGSDIAVGYKRMVMCIFLLIDILNEVTYPVLKEESQNWYIQYFRYSLRQYDKTQFITLV